MEPIRTKPVIDFQPYVAERTQHFTGREWVFEQIDDWLGNAEGSRFFLITGDPGTGKTAISGRLYQFSEGQTGAPVDHPRLAPGFLSAVHFCSANDRRWINPFVFTESIAMQLSHRFPPFARALIEKNGRREIRVHVEQHIKEVKGGQVSAVVIDKLDLSGVSVDDVFTLVVREPLEALFSQGFVEPVVLLIDALDETLGYDNKVGIVKLLAEAERLPARVRFIVSARPEIGVTRRLNALNPQVVPLAADAGLVLSLRDAERFVRDTLARKPDFSGRLAADLPAEDFVAAVRDKSKGNFLYLSHLLEMLSKQAEPITRRNLDDLPSGLDALYLQFLGRLVDGRDWHKRHACVVGTLAVAQQALSEDQLAGFTGRPADQVRWLLTELRQVLDADDRLAPDRRTYAIYHRSFADFVTHRGRAQEYWCVSEGAHRRVADYYTTRFRSRWGTCDDYGLRHLTYHVIKAGGAALLADVLDPAFLGAKAARFGGDRAVLDDLGLAVVAAREAGDLALLLRWGWAHVALRDRLSHLVNAEALPLLVLQGQVEQALDWIDALDEDSLSTWNEKDRAVTSLACALAERGDVEAALRVARRLKEDSDRNSALCQVARRVASRDRQRAITIAAEGRFAAEQTELCRVLAEDDTFVEEAIRVAGKDGRALEAVALQVARRSPDRALQMMATIPPYEEIFGGYSRTRDHDVARADLAILLAADDPDRALALLPELRSELEMRRAIIGVAGALAVSDPQRALALVASFPGEDSFSPEDSLAHGLALANVAAQAPALEMTAEAVRRWGDSPHKEHLYLVEDTPDLLGRIDLVRLRNHTIAREIAGRAVKAATEKNGLRGVPHYKYAYQAAGQLAAALAIFDVDQALQFVEWSCTHFHDRDSSFREEVLLTVAGSVARFDPPSARLIAEKIPGFQGHLALVAIVRAASAHDFDGALAIADAVEPRFSRTKTELLSILGSRLRPDQKEHIRDVLRRLPRYTQSDVFREPVFMAAMALSGEVARHDIDRGLDLARRYRGYGEGNGSVEHLYLVDAARSAAAGDPDRAGALAGELTEGVYRAQVLLAAARASPTPEAKLGLLRAAAGEMERYPPAAVADNEVLADIVSEMAPLVPWSALDLAKKVYLEREYERALAAAFRAILDLPDSDVEIHLAHDVRLSGRDRMDAYRRQLTSFQTLFVLLSAEQTDRVLHWLEQVDREMANRLRAWCQAETDPNAALAMFVALGDDGDEWRPVVERVTERDPDVALAIFREGAPGDDPPYEATVLGRIIGTIARRDVSRALQMIEAEKWQFESYKWEALGSVARTITPHDWKQALDIAGRIPDEYERAKALGGVVKALPLDLPREEAGRAYADLAVEADRIREPRDRQNLYITLTEKLLALPFALPAVVAAVTAGLALGDRGNFFGRLPDLVRLACKEDRDLALRLEGEIKYVMGLLDA
jgi:hypothetical protein